MKLEYCLSRVLLGAVLLAGTATASSDGDADPLIPNLAKPVHNGFHLYHVSGYFGYSSFPGSFFNVSEPTLGADVAAWSGLSVGYTHDFGPDHFSLTYEPSYSGHFTFNGLHSFNQALSMTYKRELGPRWTFALTGRAEDKTLEEFLFQPTSVSQSLTGSSSASQTVTDLTSSASVLGPLALQASIYGQRVRSISSDVSVAYHPTTRLTITGNAFATDAAAVRDKSEVSQYLVSHTFYGEGFLKAAYSLTPLTSIGVQAGVTQVRSSFDEYRVVSTAGTLGKSLGHRWFVLLEAGLGQATSLRTVSLPKYGLTYQLLDSIGFAGRENSFGVAYSRRIGDSYGLGASSTSSITGMWNWHDRAHHWELSASGGQLTMAGSYLGDITAWELGGGVSRQLSRKVNLLWSNAYLSNSGASLGSNRNYGLYATRIGVVWVPFLSENQPLIR